MPDLEAKINEIASEVPALDCLEKKVGLMNELNPELKALVKDINEVTSDEDMKAAKKGGEAIKKALESQKTDVDDVEVPSFEKHTEGSKETTLKAAKKIAERASEVADENP